jgi:PKD repeat protein
VSPSFSAANLDGPSSHTVKVEVKDPAGEPDTDEATVNVDNVEPTIQSISSNLTQTLTGTSVSFDAQTTDPSTADTNAGFTYAWLVDGVANSFTGNPLNHSFSDCGDHSVSATATDKDGGESASVTSDVVSVREAHFQPPLDEGVYNTVQKGRVVPVKISIGCGGANLTDLSPAIQLLKGDKTAGGETASDAIETFSSSAADTTGFMRAVDGGYIYNLQVPSNALAGELFTIRVRPFGDSITSDMRVVLKIRK